MFRIPGYIQLAIYLTALIIVSCWIGQQAYSWMPPQATQEAARVDSLFSFLTSIGTFILFGLVGIILYSALFYRAKPDDYSEGDPARGSVKIEILWLVIPTVLVLYIEAKNISIYQQLHIIGLSDFSHLHTPFGSATNTDVATSQQAPKKATQQIEVTAKQWLWKFRYPNHIVSSELHIPVNEKTRLDLRSEDVIHGFYVPAFRLKQDIFPARNIALVITPNRVGKYRLQDSSFSGTDFATMQADVYVESHQEYDSWLRRMAKQPADGPQAAVQSPKPLIQTGWNALPGQQATEARTSRQISTHSSLSKGTL